MRTTHFRTGASAVVGVKRVNFYSNVQRKFQLKTEIKWASPVKIECNKNCGCPLKCSHSTGIPLQHFVAVIILWYIIYSCLVSFRKNQLQEVTWEFFLKYSRNFLLWPANLLTGICHCAFLFAAKIWPPKAGPTVHWYSKRFRWTSSRNEEYFKILVFTMNVSRPNDTNLLWYYYNWCE